MTATQPMPIPVFAKSLTIQEIMRGLRQTKEFRGQLPYLELSHHTGKQIIPDMMNENFYETTIENKGKKYPAIRFLSDITGKWEEFLD